MFDLSKLGDMTKLAKEAQSMQAAQEKSQKEQLELLKKISAQLDTLISLARNDAGKR
jgi:hypothetical protein